MIMGIFQAMAKEIGLDVDYRDRYFEAHPGQYHDCAMCDKRLDRYSKGDDAVTIDHIWPQKPAIKYRVLARPLSSIYNLQVLCRSCNSSVMTNTDIDKKIRYDILYA
jgi:5-methylcytosine-specific restriction endonuclease McrA